MPFVSSALLAAAVEGLQEKHAMAVVVLPGMVRTGVRVTDSAAKGKPYGSKDEIQVLKTFFSVPGSPPDRPFRAVWEKDPKNYWRDALYPGRSLQRIRTDRVKSGKVFRQAKTSGGPDLWSLTPECGPELLEYISEPVRVVDLAIWYGRAQEIGKLDELIEWFLREFPLAQDRLVGTAYTEEIPAHYRDLPLSPESLSQTEYAEVLGAAPAPTAVTVHSIEFASRLEEAVTASGFVSARGLVARVVSAWARGDIVVLLGSPGTGKTRFTYELSKALKSELSDDVTSVWIAVRNDFDDAEFIGYERLDGAPQLRDFALQVLKSDNPLSTHLVVLEEFNLTQLETYLSRVLVALQDPERRLTLPGGEEVRLPVDALFLATCNSYLEEPETRVRMSFPAKRRASIISMPNVLLTRWEEAGAPAIGELAVRLIAQERDHVRRRVAAGRASSWDTARLAALDSVTAVTDLSEQVREALITVVEAMLDTPEGKSFFTMGILRDIALAIAFAPRESEAELLALGQAVADKLVHQIRGIHARGDQLISATTGLPNAGEIALLVERMKSGVAGELIPLV